MSIAAPHVWAEIASPTLPGMILAAKHPPKSPV
jgi:hypothetical protein